MKHIILSSVWVFGAEPFSAYRCELIYGRNKRDREFLPVKDVIPMTQYTVGEYGKASLYTGTDKAAAEAAKAKYDAEQKAKADSSSSWTPTADLKAGLPILPEGKFRVIKTKDKGTILVVPGEDKSNRVLIFVGCTGGFRGGVGVIGDGTNGTILKECAAGNNCESSAEVIVLLEVGQSIAFHASGRRTNEVYLYTWNGKEVEKKHFSKSEWDNRAAIAAPAVDEAEVL